MTVKKEESKSPEARLKALMLDRDLRKGFRVKFDKTKVVYEGWKKILPILKDVAVEHRNGNMKEAERLFEIVYVKFKDTTSIKHALSESEIKKILQKKDFVGTFAEKMVQAENVLAGAQKYIEKGTVLCNIASSLYGLYVGHTYRHIYKRQLSKAAELRMQMYHGQEQMMHVVSIAKQLSKFAPPGIQEYLEYNLTAFEACGKAFDLVSKYAEKIEKLSDEVFTLLNKNLYSKKSYWLSGNAAGYNDLEMGLDVELNSK